METSTLIPIVACVFAIGYIFIALEHKTKVNKAAPALSTGAIIWAIVSMHMGKEFIVHELPHHMAEISSILFFLIEAMLIVELIDMHGGFDMITNLIKTTEKKLLYWIIAFFSFIFSAGLDNLTTTIVMVALISKMMSKVEDRWTFSGIVVISANAGGAWSVIGDVTTIMLWNAEKLTAWNTLSELIIPSIVSTVVSVFIISLSYGKGQIEKPKENEISNNSHSKSVDIILPWEKNLVFFIGVTSLIMVPILKQLIGLPPFLGAMVGLSVLWVFTEILHKRHPDWESERGHMTVSSVIRRIDHESILFFLGILLAVSGLQSVKILEMTGVFLNDHVGNIYGVTGVIGVLSAIVDNVPLVAASMGMYSYPVDHTFWHLLAFCAGTGGSILIIGSAAGVAAMGILKINFNWYFRKIGVPAFVGYLTGVGTFWLQQQFWMM